METGHKCHIFSKVFPIEDTIGDVLTRSEVYVIVEIVDDLRVDCRAHEKLYSTLHIGEHDTI